MKKINLYILGVLIALFSSCEKDIEMIKTQEGIPSMVESSIEQNSILILDKEYADSVVYELAWTYADYLGGDTVSSVLSDYIVEISKTADFADPIVIHPPNYLTYGFSGIEINTILIEKLGAGVEETVDAYFRVQSTFNGDVLVSNTISDKFTTYRLEELPAIFLPPGEKVYVVGAAIDDPTWPIPEKYVMTKVSETVYTHTVFLKANSDYEMIANLWDQAYHLPAGIDRESAITSGTFVEDGNVAHDEYGNEVNRWEGQAFFSPPEDGMYKITLDFQSGTYTVVPGDYVAPKIFLPPNGEVYIYGEVVGNPWPFSDDIKLTQESETVYSIVLDIQGGEGYEYVTDQAWSQAYKVPAGVVPADVTLEGEFVEDGGKAHDESGNEVERWEGQNFVAPAEAGTYKFTVDFQTGTYTVVKQ